MFNVGVLLFQDLISARTGRNRLLSDDLELRNKSKSPPLTKKQTKPEFNDYEEDFDDLNRSPKDRHLSRSLTAQGNLSEASKLSSVTVPVLKSQSSSNLKSEPPESISASAKRTESQNFDRIRVQHQNFIDKNSTNKKISDSDEHNEVNRKKEVIETNSEEIISEHSVTSSEMGAKVLNSKDISSNSILMNSGTCKSFLMRFYLYICSGFKGHSSKFKGELVFLNIRNMSGLLV